MEACDDDGYVEVVEVDGEEQVDDVDQGEGESVPHAGVDIFNDPIEESELAGPDNDPIEDHDDQPEGENEDKTPSPEHPPQSKNGSHPVQTPEAVPSSAKTTPPVTNNKGSPDSMPPPPVPMKKEPRAVQPPLTREEVIKRLEEVKCLVGAFVGYVFYPVIF